ncbi:MAG: hypothetical protein Q7S10_03730 [bacterium]|nr:hypothetical protein [bacterium]
MPTENKSSGEKLDEQKKEVKIKGKKASEEAREAVLLDARRKAKEAGEPPSLKRVKRRRLEELLAQEEAKEGNPNIGEIEWLKRRLEEIYNEEEKNK